MMARRDIGSYGAFEPGGTETVSCTSSFEPPEPIGAGPIAEEAHAAG